MNFNNQDQLNAQSICFIYSPSPLKQVDSSQLISSYYLLTEYGTQERVFTPCKNELKSSIELLRRQSANPIDKDENFSKSQLNEDFQCEIEEFSLQLEEILVQ